MGSPYHVHTHVNRTHVVKTYQGYLRVAKIVEKSMDSSNIDECSPEARVLQDLLLAYQQARDSKSRAVVFLEARYEWTGWEKFQRVIIFDFSVRK